MFNLQTNLFPLSYTPETVKMLNDQQLRAKATDFITKVYNNRNISDAGSINNKDSLAVNIENLINVLFKPDLHPNSVDYGKDYMKKLCSDLFICIELDGPAAIKKIDLLLTDIERAGINNAQIILAVGYSLANEFNHTDLFNHFRDRLIDVSKKAQPKLTLITPFFNADTLQINFETISHDYLTQLKVKQTAIPLVHIEQESDIQNYSTSAFKIVGLGVLALIGFGLYNFTPAPAVVNNYKPTPRPNKSQPTVVPAQKPVSPPPVPQPTNVPVPVIPILPEVQKVEEKTEETISNVVSPVVLPRKYKELTCGRSNSSFINLTSPAIKMELRPSMEITANKTGKHSSLIESPIMINFSNTTVEPIANATAFFNDSKIMNETHCYSNLSVREGFKTVLSNNLTYAINETKVSETRAERKERINREFIVKREGWLYPDAALTLLGTLWTLGRLMSPFITQPTPISKAKLTRGPLISDKTWRLLPAFGMAWGTMLGTLSRILEHPHVHGLGKLDLCNLISGNPVLRSLNNLKQLEITNFAPASPLLFMLTNIGIKALSSNKNAKKERLSGRISNELTLLPKKDLLVATTLWLTTIGVNLGQANVWPAGFDPSGHVMMQCTSTYFMISAYEYMNKSAQVDATKVAIFSMVLFTGFADAIFMANTTGCYHKVSESVMGSFLAVCLKDAVDLVDAKYDVFGKVLSKMEGAWNWAKCKFA